MRRSGKWDDSDHVLQSELYSSEAFASASVDEIRNELNISDVLMQDVCEYMELHKHIDVTERLTTGIIKKIRATKLGFRAYKFETYPEKNETLIYQDKFKKSVLDTNLSVKELNDTTIPQQFEINKRLTKAAIWVAAASALISLGTFVYSILKQEPNLQPLIYKQQQTLDSLKQTIHLTNGLLNEIKTTSYSDTLKPATKNK